MVRTVLCIVMVLGAMAQWGSASFGETLLLPKGWFAQSSSNFCRNLDHALTGTRSGSFLLSSTCQPGGRESMPSSITFSKKQEPFDLQKVPNLPSLGKQGGSRIVQVSKEIPLIAQHLTAAIQLAYRDPFLQSASVPPLTQRMGAQIVLNGDWETMKYHAEYGYAGQESGKLPLSTPNGKMGGKVQWEWKLPLVTPTIELSRYSDNVESDPFQPRTIASMQKFSLHLGLQQDSQLSLSYGREQRDVFTQPDGPLTNSMTTDSALAKLSLAYPVGTGFLSTRYRTTKNSFGEQGTRQEIGSTMGGTWHFSNPIDVLPEWGFFRQIDSQEGLIQDRMFGNISSVLRLTPTQQIKPRFEFHRTHDFQSNQRTDTFCAKLGYSYMAWDHSLRLALSGRYVLKQTTLSATTPQTYDVALLIHKDLQPYLGLPHRQQTLSIKVSHNQLIDTFSSPTPTGQTTAMLMVSIVP
jgi:hypothetical protein